MVDMKKLDEGLESLTGLDFEAAEKRVRMTHEEFIPVIGLSTYFQEELAAQALGINVHELKALPLREFYRVVSRVSNFLYGTSGSETVAGN